MKFKISFFIVPVLFAILSFGCTSATNGSNGDINLTISAASSLKDALDEVIDSYKAIHDDVNIIANYGSSGSLMSQINEGAKVDLFISAAQSQMDALHDRGLLLEETRSNILQNSLVFIIAKGKPTITLDDIKTEDLETIAIGETNSVPAGQYAKEAFEKLGLYEDMEDKLLFAKDVRTVLRWVESNNVQGGIVYSSDASISDKVEISFTIPPESHAPITYPAAVIKDSSSEDVAKVFLDYLRGEEASEIFEYFGFQTAK
ncbi:molybdate ABC transporter substrate-binding protein [Alkalibacter saccharofermentans]|uniref:Molybdate transport system substrate-binding protein n=1 Tax=Alkalibacter saccharofermentans DSM 14828 TaxID=1120975 RepID=A0A1M4SAM0_9FIRM|nr:molybdate ABC transporter substrate-binding protein [Alkalibacter saccharofermentans]SHE29256.1 molybdate transport system substrate-binding protein [Alkalibacter saccharofermentans DSM 14828]